MSSVFEEIAEPIRAASAAVLSPVAPAVQTAPAAGIEFPMHDDAELRLALAQTPTALLMATLAHMTGDGDILGCVDIVDSRLSRAVIQGCLLEGGGVGAGRSDRAGVGDHRRASPA